MARDLVFDSAAMSFRLPTSAYEKLFRDAPDTTFFHLRDAIGSIFGSHRREWLQKTQAQLDTRGLKAQPLSSKAGTPGGFLGNRSMFYKVFPKSKKRAQGQTLSDITAEAYTRSKVALGLELGGTFRSRRSRFLAIPIGVTLQASGKVKPRWANPRLFRKGKKEKTLFVEEVKPGNLILFWKKSKKAPRLAAFRLVPKITRRKRLKFLDTWAALSNDRDIRLSRALDRIVKDMAKGKK